MRDKTTVDRRTFLRLSGLAGITGITGVASADSGRESEVLVGVNSTTTSPQAAVERHLPSTARVRHENSTLGYAVVELPRKASTQTNSALRRAVETGGPVEYVEPQRIHRAFYTPNDPGFDEQYADQLVNAPAAWERTLGDAGITIGVVDAGVAYNHPDLQASMASDPGYDFISDDSDPAPNASSEYHGTHVAGIAAASIDNGTGVTGIGNSTIVSARVLSENGGPVSAIADGIQYVADRGADVINLSLGGGGPSQTIDSALTYAVNQGALVVAAAGNSGQQGVSYPAANSKCLAVSAIDPDGSLAQYSTYGAEIELAAPGTNVLSTVPGGYGRVSGTSMACPVVAGTAGLTLAQTSLSNSELRTLLKNTAVDIGLPASQQGSGRVDAANAVLT
jgi:serine protease